MTGENARDSSVELLLVYLFMYLDCAPKLIIMESAHCFVHVFSVREK